jgi:hypothetical protein
MKGKMILVTFLVLAFSFSGLLAAPLSPEEITDLFSQAKSLFRDANSLLEKDPASAKELYRKSALFFERIVHEGNTRNGKIFYDIGNARFRLGDVGRAILNYRRARLYMPNDLNLNQNLEYAKSKRVDKVVLKEEAMILRILFFWHFDLSAETKLALFTLFFVAVFVCAGLLLFFRRTGLKVGLFIGMGLAAILLVSLVVDLASDASQSQGVIVADQVIARKGDSDAYSPSFEDPLHSGTEFALAEKRGDWWNIELPDGTRCWIPASDGELIKLE